MSGIEIAGLVLGALPLLLKGIDGYASSLSRIDQTVNPSRELRRARDRLYLESVIFDNTCRILLASMISPEEIDGLLREPSGKQWKEPRLQSKFEQTLDTSSIPVQKAISEIHGAVTKLQKSFYQKVDSRGNIVNTAKFSSGQKIWFGLTKHQREDKVNCIRDNNDRFAQLVKQNCELEPIRTAARRRRRNFVEVRQEATALYFMLEQPRHCQCRPPHDLYLCLEPEANTQGRARCQFLLTTSTATLASFETTDNAAPAGRQQVAVRQLCDSVLPHHGDSLPRSVGFLEHGTSERRGVVLSAFYLGKVDRSMGSRNSWSGRDRRRLASTMAASVLRLHSTPWVEEQWTRDQVLFARVPAGLKSVAPVIEHKALNQPVSTQRAGGNHEIRLISIRSEPLFALGVFLIEICLKKSFAELAIPEDRIANGMLDCLTEFRTAIRVLPDVRNEAGKRYFDAVRRCIRCDFDQEEYDLSDEKFSQAVFEKVVSLLQEDVRVIDGPEALAECASGFVLP